LIMTALPWLARTDFKSLIESCRDFFKSIAIIKCCSSLGSQNEDTQLGEGGQGFNSPFSRIPKSSGRVPEQLNNETNKNREEIVKTRSILFMMNLIFKKFLYMASCKIESNDKIVEFYCTLFPIL